MNHNKAIGMFMGLFIGDALGAPLEFVSPDDITSKVTKMVGGGVHECRVGEWTDDGAMAMAIADAYIKSKAFDPQQISRNMISWGKTGEFGTRDYVFDIGRTCSESLKMMDPARPYAGSTEDESSGNGSIMRLAPVILFNHNNIHNAVAQSIAVSLMTHGNADIVNYTAAFVSETILGSQLPNNDGLRQYNTNSYRGKGSIMHAYATAWDCVYNNACFKDALVDAVNRGHDADTVGAVTGMLAGSVYGYNSIPREWLRNLVDCDKLLETAEELYSLGLDL